MKGNKTSKAFEETVKFFQKHHGCSEQEAIDHAKRYEEMQARKRERSGENSGV